MLWAYGPGFDAADRGPACSGAAGASRPATSPAAPALDRYDSAVHVHHPRRSRIPLPRRRLGGRRPHRPRTGDRHRPARLDPVRRRPPAGSPPSSPCPALLITAGATPLLVPAAPPDVVRRARSRVDRPSPGTASRRLPRQRPRHPRPTPCAALAAGALAGLLSVGPRALPALGVRLRRPAALRLPGQRVPPDLWPTVTRSPQPAPRPAVEALGLSVTEGLLTADGDRLAIQPSTAAPTPTAPPCSTAASTAWISVELLPGHVPPELPLLAAPARRRPASCSPSPPSRSPPTFVLLRLRRTAATGAAV